MKAKFISALGSVHVSGLRTQDVHEMSHPGKLRPPLAKWRGFETLINGAENESALPATL